MSSMLHNSGGQYGVGNSGMSIPPDINGIMSVLDEPTTTGSGFLSRLPVTTTSSQMAETQLSFNSNFQQPLNCTGASLAFTQQQSASLGDLFNVSREQKLFAPPTTSAAALAMSSCDGLSYSQAPDTSPASMLSHMPDINHPQAFLNQTKMSPLSHYSGSAKGSPPQLEALHQYSHSGMPLATDEAAMVVPPLDNPSLSAQFLQPDAARQQSPPQARSVSPSSTGSSTKNKSTTAVLFELMRQQKESMHRAQALEQELVKALDLENAANARHGSKNTCLNGVVGAQPMQVSDGVQLNLVDYVTDERRQQQVLREQQQAILRAEMQRLQRQQQQQQQQQAVQAMHQRSKLQTQMDHSTPPIPLLIGTSTLTTNQSTAHLPPPPVTAGNHEFCAEHVTAESSPGEPVVVVDAAQSTQNTLRNGSKTTETARPGARKRKATANSSGHGPVAVDTEDAENEDHMAADTYQSLRWKVGQENNLHQLASSNHECLGHLDFKMEADKGFLFSLIDDSFVCQKKNHFQITVLASLPADTVYVMADDGQHKLENLYIEAYGVKIESPLADHIQLEQSTKADRKRYPFQPVPMELNGELSAKITIMRLHFSKTTDNNGRKKGKPNSDQRYFSLVVSVLGRCENGQDYVLASQTSERIIVRATNPSQFETDVEVTWRKCQQSGENIFHVGRVGINTEKPEESLDVHGNLRVTGNVYKQSDERVKQNIQAVDAQQSVDNIQKVKVYRYDYKPEYADVAGIDEESRREVGVIAQEVQEIMPDAVKEVGDVELGNGEKVERMLVVNKDRIYMESVGAVQELCKVTGNLETRIHDLEDIRKKRLAERKKMKSGVGCMIGAGGCMPVKYEHHSQESESQPYQKDQEKREVHVTTHEQQQAKSVCTPRLMRNVIIALISVILICVGAMVALYTLKDDEGTTNNVYVYNLPPNETTATSPVGSTMPLPNTTSATSTIAPSPPSVIPLPSLCTGTDVKLDVSSQNEIINCLPILADPIPDIDDVSQCCQPDFPVGFTLQPIVPTPASSAMTGSTQPYDRPQAPLPLPQLVAALEIPDHDPQVIKPGASGSSAYYMVVRSSAGYDRVNLTLNFSYPYMASYCFPAVSRQTNCVVNSSATLQQVNSPQGLGHIFELAISLSLEMWHGVRVYPPGSNGNCDSPDSEEGYTFWSFNFFFDHLCNSRSDSPPAAESSITSSKRPTHFAAAPGPAFTPEAYSVDA